ncbi:hypothetical protein BJ138DRAFT_297265 [Hygrophoropsis aurantiaca]|uniref:Uncharacterized protein n=1 Tax=Hygrophoropsis aurantiaca TaxID=72124 RepID=A0ACB8APG7_9AGAM|nr:hypothetical protein BJ138DRAFT_297265 [Hygrophoropsis aurantiaca]
MTLSCIWHAMLVVCGDYTPLHWEMTLGADPEDTPRVSKALGSFMPCMSRVVTDTSFESVAIWAALFSSRTLWVCPRRRSILVSWISGNNLGVRVEFIIAWLRIARCRGCEHLLTTVMLILRPTWQAVEIFQVFGVGKIAKLYLISNFCSAVVVLPSRSSQARWAGTEAKWRQFGVILSHAVLVFSVGTTTELSQAAYRDWDDHWRQSRKMAESLCCNMIRDKDGLPPHLACFRSWTKLLKCALKDSEIHQISCN